MKKLTVENLNAFISSVSIADSAKGIKLPRSITYPTQEYLDFNLIIERRDEFKDLFRQNLVAFSKRKIGLPFEFLYCTGERTEEGVFKKWTSNKDDVDRFVSMGILTKLILKTEVKKVDINGERIDNLFLTLSDEEIKPVVVREESK